MDKVFVRDHLDIRYVILTGGDKVNWKVRCNFGKDSVPGLTKLSAGQPVVVEGLYDGYGKNIIMKECVLRS